MSLVVNTNTSALLVRRSLTSATTKMTSSLQRLSTGTKINEASDDAAGLTISEGLKAQYRGANVAKDNAQHGINLLQTAEGDLSVIQDNLQRIRDLAVQGANGTYGSAERSAIYQEVQARTDEIDRMAKVSKFNNIQLLSGNHSSLSLQIGGNSPEYETAASLNVLTIGSVLTSATASSLGLVSISGKFESASTVSSFISIVDTAIETVSKQRSDIGAIQNRLDSTIESLTIKHENLTSSESKIMDVDVAVESANLAKEQILQQASASLLAQANQAPSVALSLI